jgi:hypothetical protein
LQDGAARRTLGPHHEENPMRIDVRLVLVASVASLLATGASAFMTRYSITNGDTAFSFEVADFDQQWTLTAPNGDVYRGRAFDSARFNGIFGMSFSDRSDITLNDAPVDATLKGKVAPDCSGGARITLKDATNRISFTLVEPFDDGFDRSCEAL